MTNNPLVSILMGSDSDLPIMQEAAQVLEEFNIDYEIKIISAHRTPKEAIDYSQNASSRGLKVIIAGAGGAAHLAGVIAALTTLPVIGVPVLGKAFEGLDSLLSMVQMPSGIPVATVAVNGAKNAGLLALKILATCDSTLTEKLIAYQQKLHDSVIEKDSNLQKIGYQQYVNNLNK